MDPNRGDTGLEHAGGRAVRWKGAHVRDTLAPENWRGIYRAKADLVRIGENSHWNLDLDYRPVKLNFKLTIKRLFQNQARAENE